MIRILFIIFYAIFWNLNEDKIINLNKKHIIMLWIIHVTFTVLSQLFNVFKAFFRSLPFQPSYPTNLFFKANLIRFRNWCNNYKNQTLFLYDEISLSFTLYCSVKDIWYKIPTHKDALTLSFNAIFEKLPHVVKFFLMVVF